MLSNIELFSLTSWCPVAIQWQVRSSGSALTTHTRDLFELTSKIY